MEAEYRNKYHQLEQSHWWFLARRDIIMGLVASFQKDAKILDIGCSGGVLMELLLSKGFENVYGIDISTESIEICRKRGLQNVFVEDAQKTHFPEGYFDVIICSDILEHIEEQEKAVLEWKRMLKKGGSIICFVPAFAFLWSQHDSANMHYRRYLRKKLCHLFRGNGFKIDRSSYWNFTLFVPVSAFRLFQKITPKRKGQIAGLKSSAKLSNSLLTFVLKIENKLILKGIYLPLGISVFVVGCKI
jgi:ubiquinone/menaquinone biosynthesis C-methylase UbiE